LNRSAKGGETASRTTSGKPSSGGGRRRPLTIREAARCEKLRQEGGRSAKVMTRKKREHLKWANSDEKSDPGSLPGDEPARRMEAQLIASPEGNGREEENENGLRRKLVMAGEEEREKA